MRAIRRSINSIGIDMEENRKISIVIPLYNGESYIRQTINSILQSTYQDLELLIINDGSTDNSVQICEEIQRQDKRIILFQKKNKGLFQQGIMEQRRHQGRIYVSAIKMILLTRNVMKN